MQVDLTMERFKAENLSRSYLINATWCAFRFKLNRGRVIKLDWIFALARLSSWETDIYVDINWRLCGTICTRTSPTSRINIIAPVLCIANANEGKTQQSADGNWPAKKEINFPWPVKQIWCGTVTQKLLIVPPAVAPLAPLRDGESEMATAVFARRSYRLIYSINCQQTWKKFVATSYNIEDSTVSQIL